MGTSVSPPAGFTWTTQAGYTVLNDAPLTITVAAADATNPRIDVPYIQVQDSFYSGAANQAIAGIVTGTPAPSPVAPAVPSNALGLANIAVAANATSIISANISSTAVGAALNGGFLKVPTLALLNLITGQPGQHATVYADTTNNGDYAWNGTNWVSVAGNSVGALVLGSGITVPTAYVTKLERNGNIVTCAFALTNSATTPTAALGSGTVIGVLPVGFRPQGNAVVGFMGYNNTGLVSIAYTIEPNGNLRAQPQSGLGATAILYGSVTYSIA